jgi:hypothetical protein
MSHPDTRRLAYLDLDALLALLEGANGRRMRRLLGEHRISHAHARGSSSNHQAWPGGFWDHTTEVLNIAVLQYRTLSSRRPLPFSLSDALLVLCAHDLEKMVRFDAEGVEDPALTAKADKAAFRLLLLDRYAIQLTPEQANALRYAEGVRDHEYSNQHRTMGPLACFVHICDLLSTRLWFNHPLASGDPWIPAQRSHPEAASVTVPAEALLRDGQTAPGTKSGAYRPGEQVAFHVARSEVRQSIRRKGLDPLRKPTWPDTKQRGIYVWIDKDHARAWAEYAEDQLGELMDIWQVRCTNLRADPSASNFVGLLPVSGSRYTDQPVAAQDCTLISAPE